MSRLHLVIADKDKYYLHSFVDYLTGFCPQRFRIVSFTEAPDLCEYLEKNGARVDILLLGTEYLEHIPENVNTSALIVLQADNSPSPGSDKKVISKYQRGDKIVSRMLEIYSGCNPHAHYLSDGSKKTRVIAVYSPVGGVGKTTIAAGASIQSAWEGKTIFYLNLEEIPSTGLFFEGEQEQNLSSILYHLRHGTKDPAVLLETARAVDPEYNIHFFKPPDSVLDLKEKLGAELKSLVRELNKTGHYDRVFIDMSSCLDQNNLAVLEACDDILVICSQEPAACLKINALVREFESLGRGKDLCLLDKTCFVLNKYEHYEGSELENANIGGKSIMLKVPKIPNIIVPYGHKYRLDMNSEFGSAVYRLTLRF